MNGMIIGQELDVAARQRNGENLAGIPQAFLLFSRIGVLAEWVRGANAIGFNDQSFAEKRP